jgi:hypothetical protein
MQPRILAKSALLSAVIVLFIFSCGGSFNPLVWKSQCERRLSPQHLIQPEKVDQLSQEIGDVTPYEIFEYIESRILYTHDLFNHASVDHLPTAEEVVRSGKDDCDGQAILLCSVLRNKGYTAYTAIGPSHAWVEVETDEPLLINYNGGTWFLRFNEETVEWDYTSLFLLILEEFVVLTVFFSLMFYAQGKGVFAYVKDVFGYLKYVLLFLSGYILIGVFVLMARSTLWLFWVVVFFVSLLLCIKLFEKVRRMRKPRASAKGTPD